MVNDLVNDGGISRSCDDDDINNLMPIKQQKIVPTLLVNNEWSVFIERNQKK